MRPQIIPTLGRDVSICEWICASIFKILFYDPTRQAWRHILRSHQPPVRRAQKSFGSTKCKWQLWFLVWQQCDIYVLLSTTPNNGTPKGKQSSSIRLFHSSDHIWTSIKRRAIDVPHFCQNSRSSGYECCITLTIFQNWKMDRNLYNHVLHRYWQVNMSTKIVVVTLVCVLLCPHVPV